MFCVFVRLHICVFILCIVPPQSTGKTVSVDRTAIKLLLDSERLELSITCTIMGGLIAQEVIKAVSGKDAPWNNVVVVDSMGDGAVLASIAKK
jgi:hypothetical protein